jgi:hypothetical protein
LERKNFEKVSNITTRNKVVRLESVDGNQNRYFYINDLLSPTFTIRKTNFDYHTGLDVMTKDLKRQKKKLRTLF